MNLDQFLLALGETRDEWRLEDGYHVRHCLTGNCPVSEMANRAAGHEKYTEYESWAAGEELGIDLMPRSEIILAADSRQGKLRRILLETVDLTEAIP